MMVSLRGIRRRGMRSTRDSTRHGATASKGLSLARRWTAGVVETARGRLLHPAAVRGVHAVWDSTAGHSRTVHGQENGADRLEPSEGITRVELGGGDILAAA